MKALMYRYAPLCIAMLLVFITFADTWFKFDKMPLFEEGLCQDDELLFGKENVKNAIVCIIECEKNVNCSSVFHVQETGICTGCAKTYDFVTDCPNGWFQIKDSCYYITDNMNFEDGVAKCKSMNSHTVVMDTEEENTNLKAKLRILTHGDVAFFTAFTDRATEATWVVDGTTNQLSFHDWNKNEPNGDTYENCLTIVSSFDMQWNDEACDKIMKTLCEKAARNYIYVKVADQN